MRALRTPDDRFENLPGWTFAPHYTEVPDGEGGTLARPPRRRRARATRTPILCMHGEPSWAYLYRKMIPVLHRRRASAPSLPISSGFGRSDKPTERDDYTYQRHVDWMTRLARRPSICSTRRSCARTGAALIGLRLRRGEPRSLRSRRRRQRRSCRPVTPRRARRSCAWREYSQTTPNFHVGGIIKGGCRTELVRRRDRGVRRAVPRRLVQGRRAQVPGARADLARRSGVGAEQGGVDRAREVGEAVRSPRSAIRTRSRGGADRAFQARVPGTKGQPHTTIEGGGHFLQEDKGEELANVIVELARRLVTCVMMEPCV